MALVYPDHRTHNQKSLGTVAISTNADGITGADVLDCAGLVLTGMVVSTGSSDANYTFRGGHTTASLQTLVNSTGDAITKGSTIAGVTPGKTIVFDPAPFSGVRFIQVFSSSCASVTPRPCASRNASVAVINLVVAMNVPSVCCLIRPIDKA